MIHVWVLVEWEREVGGRRREIDRDSPTTGGFTTGGFTTGIRTGQGADSDKGGDKKRIAFDSV